MKLHLEQEGKQKERLQRILPIEGNTHRHPYCDKNDSHWYSVALERLRLSSGAFEITRGVQIASYYNDGTEIEIGNIIGKINMFSFIQPDLISFAGVLNDRAYLFSRPLEIADRSLIFPSLKDLLDNNYSPYGLYFPIREITAYDNDMQRIVEHLNSFRNYEKNNN